MSDYETERDAANDAVIDAIEGYTSHIWTRAERLAEAQVHATLAVAAAVVALAWPPMRIMSGVRDFAAGGMVNVSPSDYITTNERYGEAHEYFTGSERADEVGAASLALDLDLAPMVSAEDVIRVAKAIVDEMDEAGAEPAAHRILRALGREVGA